MASLQKITPCLWFDRRAEEAAAFYVSVFEAGGCAGPGIDGITRYGKEGFEIHGMPEGTALTVGFRLAGQSFTALNGGPHFTFTEAISLVVHCEDQQEVDHYWARLGEGGDETAQQCGWLKDRFGLSWQIVPEELLEIYAAGVSEQSERTMKAMLQMKKLDLAELRRAYAG